jgi:hypothetical protein
LKNLKEIFGTGNILLPIFLSTLMVLLSCVNQPNKIIIHPEPSGSSPPVPPGEGYQIINFRDMENGSAFPLWVNRYLDQGTAGVEALEKYQGKYVFIRTNRGINFNALNQWAVMFSAVQDFPQLAAERVEKRLLANASLYPDDEYGEFFETLVKKAFDAEYPGAVREDDYWILQKSDGTDTGESYFFLILISIDKTLLQPAIASLMDSITVSRPPTHNQAAAINRVRENFFEGF